MAQLVRVASKKSLEGIQVMKVEAGGQKIALFNVGGTCYAIGDTCTHRGGPLSEGTLEGTTVTCPWHRGKFDVTSGKVLAPPPRTDVPCFHVSIDGDDINIEIP
ncbi:MAG: non-heme iron oxygenase ferredoxin subunit [Ignavibacteria bacterium]|nr:non-heme iron oxygenase ferredoxin subunit [Ignavibacteria bacterium]